MIKLLRNIVQKLGGRKIAINKRTFAKNPTQYNKKLARVAGSIDLDNTAEGESECANLKLLGFAKKDIQIVNQDSDTLIFAEKQIVFKRQEAVLKVISIRGSDIALSENAFKDWKNNLTAGDLINGTTHKGFEQSARSIIQNPAFKSFLEQCEDAVFLVTGHSRGGALAAEIMNYMLKSMKISKDNVFGYTFGAPCTIRGEAGKDPRIGELTGLHQVENENDKVPMLPPEILGWTNRGIVRIISFPGNVLEAHSLKGYIHFA